MLVESHLRHVKHPCYDDVLTFSFLCLFLIRHWDRYSVCSSRTSFHPSPPWLLNWRRRRVQPHSCPYPGGPTITDCFKSPRPLCSGWVWMKESTRGSRRAGNSLEDLGSLPTGHGLAVASVSLQSPISQPLPYREPSPACGNCFFTCPSRLRSDKDPPQTCPAITLRSPIRVGPLSPGTLADKRLTDLSAWKPQLQNSWGLEISCSTCYTLPIKWQRLIKKGWPVTQPSMARLLWSSRLSSLQMPRY